MRLRKLFITATLLLAPSLASAQAPLQTPAEREALIRDAYAAPYGKMLIARLGEGLRRDADPACLSSDKGLKPELLEARGRDLLINWSLRFTERMSTLYDAKAYAEKFPDSAELEKLKQNADVKKYLAITAPARQVKMLDPIIENFSRYLLVYRVKLRFVSPLETGDTSNDPTDAVEKAAEKFIASRKSKALDRYLDLVEQAAPALTASIKKDEALAAGAPVKLFKGVEADLAELCIGSGK